MSFEGIQFLQKIFSGQAIIQQWIQFIMQFVVGRVYYFDASMWLFNHEQSPYFFHFYT